MTEWITDLMNSLGYWGIGLLMFLENLFPPIPSEVIMPLAGFAASQGKMQLVPAIAAGVIGTMLGALPWYYVGKIVGEFRLKRWADRYGKWLGISQDDIEKSKHWFMKHGNKTVLFCRLVPGIRTLISLPAGFTSMPLVPFLLYSMVGTLGWVSLLTCAGYLLGANYLLIEQYLGPVSKLVLLAVLVAFGVWLFLKQRKRESRN